MKTIKAPYYLVPIAVCLLGIAGLVYYYFFQDFSKEEAVTYLYIDDDDTADSVYVKLEPIATGHGLTGLKCLARQWGYQDHVRTGRYAIQPDENVITIFRNLKNGHQ